MATETGRGPEGATETGRRLAEAAKLTVFETDAERERDEALDVPGAATFLGVDEEELAALVAQGDVPTGPRGLGYHDVAALGLNSGLRTSVSEQGLMMMMRFARQPLDKLLAPLEWSFQIQVPADVTLTGPLEVRQPNEGGEFVSVETSADGRALTGRLRTYGVEAAPFVSKAATELYDAWVSRLDSGALRFQWVSDEGRRHPALRVAEGRVDCVCMALVSAEELQHAGLATRLESGRVLGLLDAQHVWTSVLDADGTWKRFDPLMEVHCRRLWGPDTPYGVVGRGHVSNAMPGWPGTTPVVTAGGTGVPYSFTARRERS